MSAMTNFTMKSLRANRVRTFVTIIGVALAAALLTAVMTTYTSLTDFLYRTEAATSGEWMANVESTNNDTLASDLLTAKDAADVTGITVVCEVGFGELTESQQDKLGNYLAIGSVEGDIEDMLGVHASEGRLPQKQGEILLYKGWNSFEGVDIGDEVTFQVGRRQAVSPKSSDSFGSASTHPAVQLSSDQSTEGITVIESGAFLSSHDGYLDSADGDVSLDEKLVDKSEQTYTVVGFYDRAGYSVSCAVGNVALTVDAPQVTNFADVYLTMSDATNAQQVEDRAEEMFPNDNVVLHIAMLRYMGIASDSSIWMTFYGIIIVLAAVIILACVSLIFNAFAISVAERTSQFGLLSSVGATRRQLRSAVILEALLIALGGTPIGILIGIGGCAVTFSVLGPGISEAVGNGTVAFNLAINPWVIVVSVLLTLVTVLLSVWIPALRASRINIIDSLRSANGSRASKRGEKIAAKQTSPQRLWRTQGLVDRIFGVGGKLAAINRKRGVSKGRTAAISLALAIVLLMTGGSLNTFLGTLVSAVSGNYQQAGDVTVAAQFDRDDDDPALTAPITAQQLLASQNETFSVEASAFTGAYDYLSATEGALAKGWTLYSGIPVYIPKDMAGSGLKGSQSHDGGPTEDGRYVAMAQIQYIDDASFDEYAQSLGLDPAAYHDAAHPRAIGISQGYGNDGSNYLLLDMLNQTGNVEVIAGAIYMSRYPVYMSLVEKASSDDEVFYDFEPFLVDDADGSPMRKGMTMKDVDSVSVDLEIAALADEVPAIMGSNGSSLTFVVPMSLAKTQGFGIDHEIFKAAFDAVDGDHATLAEELTTRGAEYFHDEAPFELSFYQYNDTVADMNSTQMLATIVNVFCLLFTVILALIAMVNVFNTVTNSFILRRREFAVMRSIGLSNRQFRRMVMDECMNFGIMGLIPGFIVSIGVSYLLYAQVGKSMSGMAFSLPWGYVALAIAMCALVMALSVAYGMHRCKADNVVEALRADSI